MQDQLQSMVGQVFERPWGRYIILELGEGHLVKRMEVDPGQRFSLQYHNFRTETWTVVSGELLVTLNDQQINLTKNGSVLIKVKDTHRGQCVSAEKAVFVEVQTGDKLSEDDIVRLEDDYGRQ